mmetsp:Transcript_11828/g.49688  ORF Transcript_11828/g.49688 Transcript_11828/m.49688 type:complete len:361 (+) Transcript_11828:838-1920(+)
MNQSVRRNRRAREEEHPRVRLRRHRRESPRLRARQRQPRRRARDRGSLAEAAGALRKSVDDGRPARRTRAPRLQQPLIHALRVKRVAARQRPQRLPALVLAEAHVTLRSLLVDAVRGPSIGARGARVGAAGAIGVAGGARGKRVNLLPCRRTFSTVAEHPRRVPRATQPGVELAEHRRHRLGEEGDAGSKRLGRRRAGFVHVVPRRAIRGGILGIVRSVVGAAAVGRIDAELARHALDRVAERVAGRTRPGTRTGRGNGSGGGGGGGAEEHAQGRGRRGWRRIHPGCVSREGEGLHRRAEEAPGGEEERRARTRAAGVERLEHEPAVRRFVQAVHRGERSHASDGGTRLLLIRQLRGADG